MKNLKQMAVVQLNVLSTGQDFAIDDSQILEAIPLNSSADSTLVFEELGRVKSINVDETCTAIASASGTVFSVTAYVSGSSGNTVTRYISALQCKELIENTTYRTIQYNFGGVELESVNVSDTLASLISSINVSSSDFVTIAGTQTVTGAKTFSAALAATSTLTVTGATTPTGGVAAAGGFSVSPRNIAIGGLVPAVSTDFTNATPVNTEVYIGEVFVPANCTITGVAVFNGSDVTDNIKVGLANSSGAIVATSASTAGSGTDAYQLVPFTATYAAKGPATYYILSMYAGSTSRYNAPPLGSFGAAKQTGQVFATGFTTITPPTTFTANLCNIASLY